MSKKEKLKKLFYSNLTETELKQELGLNYKEYRLLLSEVKQELGLPTSYRRKPRQYGNYSSDSYYLLKVTDDDIELISYFPTKELAENACDDNEEYIIDIASDENMMKLIKKSYYVEQKNWETIMEQYKLPYHEFYRLLNMIKSNMGRSLVTSNKSNRFIYKYNRTNKYVIRKYLDGKYKNFGYYDTIKIAKYVRDYLESISWNSDVFKNNKKRILGEIK